jgi:hypothetical protein
VRAPCRENIPDAEITATTLNESVVRLSARGWIVELDVRAMAETNAPDLMRDPSQARDILLAVRQRIVSPAQAAMVFRFPDSFPGARIIQRPTSTYRRLTGAIMKHRQRGTR